MSKRKRGIGVLLVCCMLLALLPSTAFAATEAVVSEVEHDKYEQFFDEASQLIADTWCEGFFGEIVFAIGSPYMWVDGVQQEPDSEGQAAPILIDGEVFIPGCVLIEQTGGDIYFDAVQQSILIEDDHVIEMELDTNILYIDGEAQYVDTAPVILDDSVMVPLDIIWDELGFDVAWDSATQEVTLSRDFQSRRLIARTVTEQDFSNLGATTILNSPSNMTVLQFETRQEAQDSYDWLSEQDSVVWVQPDRFQAPAIQPMEEMTTPFSGNPAWPASPLSWGTERVGAHAYAEFLYQSGRGEQSIIVAVIDTGIYPHHPFLQDGDVSRVIGRRCFIGGPDMPYDRDSRPAGHGTPIAGIIVDSMPNLNVQFLDGRMFPCLRYHGAGPVGGHVWLSVANAVRWATINGADVINMSLGSEDVFCIATYDSIQMAIREGVTVIAIAQNRGHEPRGYAERIFPGNLPNVITAAATDDNDIPVRFQAWRWATGWGRPVDISAPGVRLTAPNRSGGFSEFGGTSGAAPLVAAAAAMYILENPGISPADVHTALRSFVYVPDGWDNTRYGTGILDMRLAIPTTLQPVSTWDGLRAAVNSASADERTIIPIAGNLTTAGAANPNAIHIPADRRIVLQSSDASANRIANMLTARQRHFTVSGELVLGAGVTLHGGTNAGGVQVNANGTLTMQQGSVIENSRWITTNMSMGGGVHLNGANALFNLGDGIIRNNNAIYGGGIAVSSHEGAEVIMRSGLIEGNTSMRSGGGVHMADNSTSSFTMTGGVISNNTASHGGGVYVAATAPGAFTMNRGAIRNNTTTNPDTGHGGGIYSVQADHSAPTVPLTAYSNLNIGPAAEFSGNRAAAEASAPPDNRLPHIAATTASRWDYVLNNYDINYTGRRGEPPGEFRLRFHLYTDDPLLLERFGDYFAYTIDGRPVINMLVSPGEDRSIWPNQELLTTALEIGHIYGELGAPGRAFWGWFDDATLDASGRTNDGVHRRPALSDTCGLEAFFRHIEEEGVTTMFTRTDDDTFVFDFYAVWSLWGDANDDGVVSAADILRIERYLHDQFMILIGLDPVWNVTINEIAANVTLGAGVDSADILRIERYLHDQLMILIGLDPIWNVVLGQRPIPLHPLMRHAAHSMLDTPSRRTLQDWFDGEIPDLELLERERNTEASLICVESSIMEAFLADGSLDAFALWTLWNEAMEQVLIEQVLEYFG
ncbi:MAG: S8 family serine peptidase [Oscillospiraceae bacterium]|nr:S8 family serine peptidase [Oscillospiraceae bacterium]